MTTTPSSAQSDELKPCPFCAHEAQVMEGTGPFWDRVQVECSACRIATFWLEEPVARQLWNRRAAASAQATVQAEAEQQVAWISEHDLASIQKYGISAATLYRKNESGADVPLMRANKDSK